MGEVNGIVAAAAAAVVVVAGIAAVNGRILRSPSRVVRNRAGCSKGMDDCDRHADDSGRHSVAPSEKRGVPQPSPPSMEGSDISSFHRTAADRRTTERDEMADEDAVDGRTEDSADDGRKKDGSTT